MGRIKEYIGPHIQITPDELPKYEKQGCWVAEDKRDGAWACMTTDESGIVRHINGRSGASFDGDSIQGIKGLNINLPNSILIGELEAASQAATKLNKLHGFRRIHIFDAIQVKGQDTTILSCDLRRKLILAINQEIFLKEKNISKRIMIVRQSNKNFVDFYNHVMSGGGEGLVLKKVNSIYKSHRSSGKVDFWIRAKEERFIDVFVMSHKLSQKGLDQLEVGIWDNDRLKRIQTILCPKGYAPEDLIGKVVEIRGAEMMESGAIRHGRFERIRHDKTKTMCII